jgi:hypothetical protein
MEHCVEKNVLNKLIWNIVGKKKGGTMSSFERMSVWLLT